jgi:hypothetical protein
MPPKKSSANQKLARAIRETHSQAGYSQERFARALGLDRCYFGAVERGESTSRSTRSPRSQPGSTRRSALCAREPGYDAGIGSGF